MKSVPKTELRKEQETELTPTTDDAELNNLIAQLM